MGKTVLVTGASGAIGSAIATAFAAQGHRVALGYHTGRANAETLCENLRQSGAQAITCTADVGDSAQVDDMFTHVEQEYGPVEILVNNAGFAQQKLFSDITDAEWHRMMDVHATGTFFCCRRAIQSMIHKKSGCIVNVSSIWGQTGASCEVHYSAAKAAVIGLTQALAKELAPSGIRVNAVAPGVISTPMLDAFTEAERQALADETPLGRFGTPQDVAGTVLFLASDAAAFLTGQVLAPNGGMYI